MKIEVGFGNGVQTAIIPDENILQVLQPNKVEHETDVDKILRTAMEQPEGTERLAEMDMRGKKIAIISSDITRPMPTYKVMPMLLDELYEAGAEPENITLVFGLGSHRKHSEEEKKKLAGERAYKEISCVDSDADDCVRLGSTKNGTVVDITRSVAEADIRICLGNIEYHYFAGYSGGAKAIMPGVASHASIQSNHTMMVREEAHAGKLEGNPIREDIEEAGRMCGIDYILNVVLDEHKQIIYAVAGDAVKAHRKGCAFLDRLYQKPLKEKADIVIVSQGGAPKDLNLYQTQKALDNSKYAVADGGTIILVGSCKEGLGQSTFERWMTQSKTPGEMIERIKENFQLGGHKAAAIAMVLEKADIYLVSEMEDDFVKSIFMRPYGNLQQAVDEAMKKHGKWAKVTVMPYGGSTLPVITE